MLKDIMQFVVRTILIFGLSFSVNASDFINAINYSIKNAVSLSGSTNQSGSSSIGASLKQIFGTVLINHGKGYSIARLGMELKSGDRVMTMDGAQAVVVQDDGCVIKLRDNSIFTLPLNSSEYSSACQGGNNAVNKSIKKIGPYYARAIGAEAVTDVSPTVSEEVLENAPLDTTILPALDPPADTAETIPANTPETAAPANTPETTAAETVVPVETAEVAEPTVVEQVEVETEAEGGSFFNNLSTTQIVVTGVAVGLGLAVIGSSGGGGGGGAVSGE